MSKMLSDQTWKIAIRLVLMTAVLNGSLLVIAAPGLQDNLEARVSEAVTLFNNKELSQAMEKFHEIGDPAIPAVMELLKSDIGSHGAPLSHLIEFIVATKGARADAALIKLLSDKSSYLRGYAAFAVGERKLRSAVPHLVRLLDDKEIYVSVNCQDCNRPDKPILVRDNAIDGLQLIVGKSFARNKSREHQAVVWLDWWRRQKEWK